MEESVAVGFFATCAVRAESPCHAAEKARSMIASDWTTGKYSELSNGAAPTFLVDEVWRSSWLKDLFFINDGHIFFPADGNEDEA
ncbi:MAG: hypothetical protein KDI80_12925, partial [Xanthomonadales bacterium]|nr:hypothetical protein [Xanthomonadales bacterium]